MTTTLSEFITKSSAEKQPDGTWTVYCDGENKKGRIAYCAGSSEFEAKEDAYTYFMELVEAINDSIE